jgi:hypothetical protein
MRAKQFGYCPALALLALPTAAQAMLQISKHKTQNMDCSGGVCTPTAQDAVLNVNDLTAMLAAGDLKVVAGGEATNIKVAAPFTWANRSLLTLSAYKSVLVNAAITAAGRGSLTVLTNTSGQGGDFVLSDIGSVTFWSLRSKFILNGEAYTLVGDIATLASDIAANPSGLYALAKDYDAHADGPYARSPILTVFTGTFLGLGHTISNLSILNGNTTDKQIGLFYELGTDSVLSDLNLASVSFELGATSDPEAHVGALAGVARGRISHATISGTLSTTFDVKVGGLIGQNYGVISASNARATFSAKFGYPGGLVGDNWGTLSDCSALSTIEASAGGGLVLSNEGQISGCHASGSIIAQGGAGGLAGYSQGSINDSSSSVSIVSLTGQAGGLVEELNAGSIERSFATGSMTNQMAVRRRTPGISAHDGAQKSPTIILGGLVGWSYLGRISESYSTGNAAGVQPGHHGHSSKVGGLLGYQLGEGSIYQSYSIGAVGLNRGYLGGVIGYDAAPSGSNNTVFWDLETSGVSDPGKGAGNIVYDKGLKGITDKGLHELPKGFDPNVWAVNPAINNGYPYLISNPPPG